MENEKRKKNESFGIKTEIKEKSKNKIDKKLGKKN